MNAYVTELNLLAQSCEFGQLCHSLIKNCVGRGVRFGRVRAKLLRINHLTQECVVDVCRAEELL